MCGRNQRKPNQTWRTCILHTEGRGGGICEVEGKGVKVLYFLTACRLINPREEHKELQAGGKDGGEGGTDHLKEQNQHGVHGRLGELEVDP